MRNIVCCILFALSLAPLSALADLTLYEAGGKNAFSLAETGGFKGTLIQQKDALAVKFKKDGSERRMIALKIAGAKLKVFRALDMDIAVKLADGQTARPSVMAVEKNGSVWYRTGMPLQQTEVESVRVNLTGMRQAAFSRDDNKTLDWDKIRELYVGVVWEGAGEGTFSIRKIVLTDQKFAPSHPAEIKVPMAKSVGRSADPAAKVSVEDVTIDGVHVLKETFKFPLGRHMYFTPQFALPELDYESYSGIRMTYKATIPEPISGLLVTVSEGGGQFVVPPPPPSADWTTVDMKFKDMTLAGWTKKTNGDTNLNVSGITGMFIGCHGTAGGGSKGEGEILVRKLELIP